ncbi:unnamed protein product [Phaeothamnion confervicola]
MVNRTFFARGLASPHNAGCVQVIAARPWSFSAAVIPVWLTAALMRQTEGLPIMGWPFLQALVMAVLVQAGANLINSLVDFQMGVDTEASSGDRCLVDRTVTPRGVLLVGIVCFAGATAIMAPHLLAGGAAVVSIYVAGTALSLLYTAAPVSLKYRALGDVTIFVCFGPLLMQCTALLLTGRLQLWTMPYAVPVALLTECILHANNARDIYQDMKAGISTLATVIGFRNSQWLYCAMVGASYVTAAALAAGRFWGCGLVALTLPMAYAVMRDFEPKSMHNMDERTAQLHLLFGVLLSIGVTIS